MERHSRTEPRGGAIHAGMLLRLTDKFGVRGADREEALHETALKPDAVQSLLGWQRWRAALLERLIHPSIHSPRMAAAAGDRALTVIEPGEAVRGNRNGLSRGLANRWDLGKPPGPAGLAFLQQQIVVEARGVVGGTGVFQQDEAGHRFQASC